MILNKFIFLSFATSAFLSCNQNEGKEERILIASANEVNLYFEDINPDKLAFISSDDSLQQLKLYAEFWAEEQILLDEAKKVLSSPDEFNELLEEYRKNLLLHSLDEKWASNFRDTIVSDEEISEYYSNNKNNFQLRKNIVKIRYLKIDEETPLKEMKKIKSWIQSPGIVNDSLLKNYAEKHAQNFFLEDDWIFYEDLIKEVPISSDYNQERFLLNNRFIQLTENNFHYMVYFLDYKFKDSVSPIEFESSNIKSYILMKRKSRWVEIQRQTLLDNAIANGQIKINLK